MSAEKVFVAVSELPELLRRGLSRAGYNRKDVALVPAETFTPHGAFGDGYRAFLVLVNMQTGEMLDTSGSWGGPNPFEAKAADDLNGKITMLPHSAILDCQEGGGRPVSARIVLHPSAIAPLLPAAPALSERALRILACVRSYTSAYRKQEFGRMGVTDSELTELVSTGMLSRNKAGAISITTAGKNACQNVRAL